MPINLTEQQIQANVDSGLARGEALTPARRQINGSTEEEFFREWDLLAEDLDVIAKAHAQALNQRTEDDEPRLYYAYAGTHRDNTSRHAAPVVTLRVTPRFAPATSASGLTLTFKPDLQHRRVIVSWNGGRAVRQISQLTDSEVSKLFTAFTAGIPVWISQR